MGNLQQRCNKDSQPRRGLSRTLAYLSLLSFVSVAASGPLAAQGVKISALPDATSAGTGDLIPCVQGGTVTRACTPADFLALLAGGPGIGISSQTISTASNEADFLISGALTCGASTQGKVQTHSTTPLQYCDNAGTPTLRYAAYGNAMGECISIANDSVALGTDTTGNYAASSSEGGAASSVAANSVTLTTDTVGNYAAGDGEAGNATGLACSACVGTTDLAGDTVTEPKLAAIDTASDEECLTYEDTASGFEWQACSADTDDQTAAEVVYTPADGTDWANPDPDDVADGLDKLADRLATEEGEADDDVPESGDFGALTLTGPVTSSGTTTSIADDAITEPMLKSVNGPTDELCLSYESTTGDFEWQACGSGGNHASSHLDGGADEITGGALAGLTTITTSGVITTGSGLIINDGPGGDEKVQVSANFLLSSDGHIIFYDNLDIGSGTPHVGLKPSANGEFKVTNGGAGSGDLLLDEEQELRFAEANANGANYLAFKAPAAVTATQTCTLEDDTSMVPDSCVGDGSDDDLPDADEIVESMLKAVDSATDEECLTFETTTGDFEWQSCAAGGSGDVVGPASSTANALSLFSGTTGKLLANSVLTVNSGVLQLGGMSSSYGGLYVGGSTNGEVWILDAAGNPGITKQARLLMQGGNFATGDYTLSIDNNGGGLIRIGSGGGIEFQNIADGPFTGSEGDTRITRGSAAVVKIDDALRLDVIASPPVTCGDASTQGVIYNDTSVALCWCDGTAWVVIGGAGSCA